MTSVTENSTIQANSVTASTTGNVDSSAAGNVIDSLSTMTVGGSLQVNTALQDVAAMFTFTGAISGSSVTIDNTQGSITDNFGITATGSGGISLTATGITQNGGTLDTTAGTGSITLDGGTGAVSLAGSMSTGGGNISVSGAGITQSAGTLDSSSGTITLDGGAVRSGFPARSAAPTAPMVSTPSPSKTQPRFNWDGSLAGSGTVSLTTTGGITQGGALDASKLTGSSGGSILLNNTSNQIAAVNSLTSDGSLTLEDSVALTVSGTVTDDLTGSNVSIEVIGAALTLAGDITTASGKGINISLTRGRHYEVVRNAGLGLGAARSRSTAVADWSAWPAT